MKGRSRRISFGGAMAMVNIYIIFSRRSWDEKGAGNKMIMAKIPRCIVALWIHERNEQKERINGISVNVVLKGMAEIHDKDVFQCVCMGQIASQRSETKKRR
jgi:hypothetical protein